MMMYFKILLLFMLAWQVNGQSQKEMAILVFDKAKMNFEDDTFVIEEQTFKYISKKKKYQVKYSDIKDNISTLDEMNLKIRKSKNQNKNKREEFYYKNFFNIYIYISENNTSGLLYPVERIWIVRDKIID